MTQPTLAEFQRWMQSRIRPAQPAGRAAEERLIVRAEPASAMV